MLSFDTGFSLIIFVSQKNFFNINDRFSKLIAYVLLKAQKK